MNIVVTPLVSDGSIVNFKIALWVQFSTNFEHAAYSALNFDLWYIEISWQVKVQGQKHIQSLVKISALFRH